MRGVDICNEALRMIGAGESDRHADAQRYVAETMGLRPRRKHIKSTVIEPKALPAGV